MEEIKKQEPAEGIMKTASWPDAEAFHVKCACSNQEHDVDMWIEVEPDKEVNLITVSFFVSGSSPTWKSGWNRWRAIWDLLWKGTHRTENHLLLNAQAATNLVGALQDSVKKLKNS